MRRNAPRFRFALALALLYILSPQPRLICASQSGYDMWFAGRIIGIDVHRARLRILRGPTETADSAIVECEMPRRALRKLHVGMEISAEADTRHTPWRIFHLRPFERFHNRGLPVSVSPAGYYAAVRGRRAELIRA